jgi:hypothetical protein
MEHNIVFEIDAIVQGTLNLQKPEFTNHRDVGTQGMFSFSLSDTYSTLYKHE